MVSLRLALPVPTVQKELHSPYLVNLELMHLPALHHVQSVPQVAHVVKALKNRLPVHLEITAQKKVVIRSHAHPEITVPKDPSHLPHVVQGLMLVAQLTGLAHPAQLDFIVVKKDCETQ